MTSKENQSLQIGDAVTWIDPATGDSGIYRVQEIVTPNGLVKAETDVLVIINDNTGHGAEVFVSELG